MKPFDGIPKVSPTRGALALQTPDEVVHIDLSGASVAVTPPAGTRFAVFSADDNFAVEWVDTTVAVYPAATDISDGPLPEINPAARFIGDRIDNPVVPATPYNFAIIGIAASTGFCSIAFYS